jgi:GT2 family glycosyltransferase
MRKPSLSLGLVVRNEASQIRELLEQIKEHWDSSFQEIIIVDNISSDATLQVIEEWSRQHPALAVKISVNNENNMATARNKILHQASAEWIYFVDADCRLHPEALQNLLAALFVFHEQADVGALGGSACPPPQRNFIYDGLRGLRGTWLGHMNSIQVKSPLRQKNAKLLSTCNFLVRKDAAVAVEGCDPDFARVGEDLSLSYRLTQKGYRLMALPNAEIIHHQKPLWSSWYAKMFRYGYAQTHMAWRYPGHFAGLRGLQFAGFLIFLVALIFFPLWLAGFAVIYLLTLIIVSQSPTTAIFILSSQGVYGAGELYGLFAVPFKRRKRPDKIPARDKE